MKLGIAILAFVVTGCSNPNEQTSITQAIEGTDFTLEMMPVPSPSGNFWISRFNIYC